MLSLLAGCDRNTALPAPQIAFSIDSLPSPAGPGSAEPYLVTAKDGRVYMTWFEADSATGSQSLRLSSLDHSTWTAPKTIVQGMNFFVNWADFPSLLPLDNGDLAAHWLERTGAGTYAYGIKVARSTDGGATWTAPLTLHRDSTETEHGFVTMWNEPQAPGTLGAAWLDGRKFKGEGHDAANEMMPRFHHTGSKKHSRARNAARPANLRLLPERFGHHKRWAYRRLPKSNRRRDSRHIRHPSCRHWFIRQLD